LNSPNPVVLLVEGDIVTRSPLAEYLRQCGFMVIEAANGDEARLALKTPDLKMEVVLADMKTAGAGFALRRWIVEEKLDVEVILAGSVEKAVEHAGDLCNEGPGLAKPYEHRLVLDQIRRALARRDRTLRGAREGA
jgi:DNA-binding NtrC family response regulator